MFSYFHDGNGIKINFRNYGNKSRKYDDVYEYAIFKKYGQIKVDFYFLLAHL